MRYKIFGRRTGLRVSELALGTANFGTRWGHGAERDQAKKVFDAYVEESPSPGFCTKRGCPRPH
jgi:aryl-alcohol dehydrogenase-like predicted oxidoreductase